MDETKRDQSRVSHNSAEIDGPGDTSDPLQSNEPAYTSLSKARQIGLVITLAGSGFLNIGIVQSTIIILPSIADSLQIQESRQQWISAAYNVAMGCTLLVWGSLADIYGRRVIFLIGSAGLAVVTVIPPFVPSGVPFCIIQALQGVFAAATLPSAIGILSTSFPLGRRRNYAITSHTAVSSLGSVVGNIMGGLISAALTWKWVFWILAMVSAVVSVSSFFLIPTAPIANPEARRRPAVDWLGATMVTGGILMLLIAITEGSSLGWQRTWIPVLIAVSVLILAMFCLWQLYLEHRMKGNPLIRMSMFSSLHFSAGLGVAISFFCSFQSYLLFATYFFQDYLGLSTIQTTLRFLPSGIAGSRFTRGRRVGICIVASLLTFGSCHDHSVTTLVITPVALSLIPPFYLLIIAACCGVISPLLFSVPIPPNTIYWAWAFPAMCLCVSVDILGPVLILIVLQTLPPSDRSLGAGLISTANQLGRTIGTVLATAVQSAVQAKLQSEPTRDSSISNPNFLYGLRAAQGFNTGMAGVALLLILCTLHGLRHLGCNK